MADKAFENPLFTPQVTPPENRPFVADDLRSREPRIPREGYLLLLIQLEDIQGRYDDSEGTDLGAESDLSDVLTEVYKALVGKREPTPKRPPVQKRTERIDERLPDNSEAHVPPKLSIEPPNLPYHG